MKCKQCDSDIARGMRFDSPTYKSVPFCSEECYTNYLNSRIKIPKENPPKKIKQSTCCVCNKTFPKIEKFNSPTYKSSIFCSEECYNRHLKIKSEDPMVKLNSEIHNLWMEEPNYGIIATQTKQIVKKYNISINDIRLIVRYAILYCDEKPNYEIPMLGLYQFIPKYMNEALEFANTIRTNKKIAENWNEEIEIHKIKPVKHKQHITKKDCEW